MSGRAYSLTSPNLDAIATQSNAFNAELLPYHCVTMQWNSSFAGCVRFYRSLFFYRECSLYSVLLTMDKPYEEASSVS